MSAAKILMVAGDAAESLEVLYPYQRLQEEGYEVKIAAPSKKKLHFVVHDFEPGYDTYTEKPGYSWDADLAFKDVKPDDYVALVIPGGRGPRVHPQRPRPAEDHSALLPAGEAGGATLSCAARAGDRRRPEGSENRRLSCAGAGC